MDSKLRKSSFVCLLVLAFFLMPEIASTETSVTSVSAEESVILPPVGSTFTFLVEATGDKSAVTGSMQKIGEYKEIYRYDGIVKDVKGRTKDGVIENSQPYDCAKWVVTRPDEPQYYREIYYAIRNNSLCYYLEIESSGATKYYPEAPKKISFPLKALDTFTTNTTFYVYVPDTGVFLSPQYESDGVNKDKMRIEVIVVGKENVSVGAGTFECFRINTKLISDQGSGITANHVDRDINEWWCPELGFFVKSRDPCTVKSLASNIPFMGDMESTVEMELISYTLGEGS